MLPPLLFESAFAIDWHIFSKVSIYSLFLALPGLIVCTIFTGLTYQWFYGWRWEAAMLLGGILSATDPVAVVALLREMGVKKSLATLIEAESLLNDGTAVVVYSILLKAVQADGLGTWLRQTDEYFGPADEWHIVWMFFRMSVLGPLFGIAMGVFSVKWLEANSGADRDANVEVICTLAMPFLVFYLAETGFAAYDMQMSGVLAVVCYGLVFASPYGKVCVDARVEHFLHEFWGMVGHLVNTLLFTLAGIIIITAGVEQTLSDHFDLGQTVALGVASYALCCVYRGVVMFGVMPLFRKCHYGYDWRDALVITWGGLRGAVGLALALAVYGDSRIPGARRSAAVDMFGGRAAPLGGIHFQQVVLIHVSCAVLLTLLINAPSSGRLLKAIGLTKLSDERVTMLQRTQQQLLYKAKKTKREMEVHPIHSDVDWPSAQRLADFDRMVADILGAPYNADNLKPWDPDGPGGAASMTMGPPEATAPSPPRTLTRAVSGSWKNLLSRASKSDSPGPGDSGAGADADGAASPTPDKEALAHNRWTKLRLKMEVASALLGDDFAEKFRERLRKKRRVEAKYLLLRTVKATVWHSFEEGQLSAKTVQLLLGLIHSEIDDVEQGRNLEEANPLPFALLESELDFDNGAMRLVAVIERWAWRSVLLRPLVHYANTLIMREFSRGYDATVGFFLGFEAVLQAHDHGVKFAQDKELDAEFKAVVKQNIAEASQRLATLRVNWPQLCTALNTARAARQVLNQGAHTVEHLGHHGGLHETEVGRLLDMIAEASSRLNSLDPADVLHGAAADSFMMIKPTKHATDDDVEREAGRVLFRRSSKRGSATWTVEIPATPSSACTMEAGGGLDRTSIQIAEASGASMIGGDAPAAAAQAFDAAAPTSTKVQVRRPRSSKEMINDLANRAKVASSSEPAYQELSVHRV